VSDSLNSSFASSSSGADHPLRSWDRHNLLLDASLDRSVVMRDLAHLRSTGDDGGQQRRRRESNITLTTLLSSRPSISAGSRGPRLEQPPRPTSSRTTFGSAIGSLMVRRPPPPVDNNNYLEGSDDNSLGAAALGDASAADSSVPHQDEEDLESLPDNYGLAIGQ
jgi:hypothetical protein